MNSAITFRVEIVKKGSDGDGGEYAAILDELRKLPLVSYAVRYA